jgi:outer membrane protein assembly factor BamB
MKYLLTSITALLWAVIVVSCQTSVDTEERKNASGAVIYKQPVWQASNTVSSNVGGGTILYSFLIGDDLLDEFDYKPGTGKPTMILRNSLTGEKKWEWNDVLRDFEPIILYKNSAFQYENYLFYNYGPRNYCIDTRTGQTLWKKVTGYSAFANSAILGATYFTKGTPQALQDQSIVEDRIYMGDIRTGKEVEVVMPAYSCKNIKAEASWKQWIGLISDVRPIKDGSDTLLLINYNETSATANKFEAYVSLYNMTQKKWVYDQKRLNDKWPEGSNTAWLTLSGDKMFTILNNAVACSNWRTGELIWFRPLPSFAAIPTAIEDKYLAVYSSDSRLFLLDINTGETIWERHETISTTTQMYYDQGVLYFMTLSLNAMEIPSGKKLWTIASPTGDRSSGNFSGFITGAQGKNGQKGRIFTRTGYNTYCYEAIK